MFLSVNIVPVSGVNIKPPQAPGACKLTRTEFSVGIVTKTSFLQMPAVTISDVKEFIGIIVVFKL